MAQVERVEHDGLVLWARLDGPDDGPVVVLLHGFPQAADTWDDVVEHLVAAGCRTIAFDQRGYDAEARPDAVDAYGMSHLVGDVVAVLDHVGIDRAHVVGHDWGGAVGWALAMRAPQRVATLTVLSTPHPIALARSFTSSWQAVRSWYVPLFRSRFAEAVVGRGLQRQLERSGVPAATAARYAERMAEPGALTGALNWYRALSFGGEPSDDDVGAGGTTIRVPTTYVWGRDDPALGPRAALLTADHVDADYRFAPLAAGHWLPETRADVVATLVGERVASDTVGSDPDRDG